MLSHLVIWSISFSGGLDRRPRDMDYHLARDRRELTARLGKGITDFQSTFPAVNLCFSSAR